METGIGLHSALKCPQMPVLKESDDLILGVTFDSKMTIEKHLRSVLWAASRKLGILKKSYRVFHDRSLLVRCFLGLVLPVLEYCSAVWCSAADTHLKLLDGVVSGASFLTGGVFECTSSMEHIAHRRCVPYGWSGVTRHADSLWCSTQRWAWITLKCN